MNKNMAILSVGALGALAFAVYYFTKRRGANPDPPLISQQDPPNPQTPPPAKKKGDEQEVPKPEPSSFSNVDLMKEFNAHKEFRANIPQTIQGLEEIPE